MVCTLIMISSLCSQSSWYINDRFVTNADIVTANGLIHTLEGPLEAPLPPTQVSHVTWVWSALKNSNGVYAFV